MRPATPAVLRETMVRFGKPRFMANLGDVLVERLCQVVHAVVGMAVPREVGGQILGLYVVLRARRDYMLFVRVDSTPGVVLRGPHLYVTMTSRTKGTLKLNSYKIRK